MGLFVGHVLNRYKNVTRGGRFRANANSNCIRTTRIVRRAGLAIFVNACRASGGRVALLPLGTIRHVSDCRKTVELRGHVFLCRLARVLRLDLVEEGRSRVGPFFWGTFPASFHSMLLWLASKRFDFQFVSSSMIFACGLLITIRTFHVCPLCQHIGVRGTAMFRLED